MAKNNDDWVDVPLEASHDDWHDIPVETSAPASDYSSLDSLGRGAVQGLSFGFGDEIKGAGKSAIQSLLESLNLTKDDGKSFGQQYTEARDADRQANALAEEANPGMYLTGDIGAGIGLGLLSGGAGLTGALAKGATKEALKQGVKHGALKTLMAIGAAEGAAQGAAQGLGRTEADLTKGEVLEAGKDTLLGAGIGALAPVAIKGAGAAIKGTAGLADDGITAIPKLGKAYTNLKNVAKEGADNVGQKLDDVFFGARDKLSGLADDIKGKRLEQDANYERLLREAQEGAASNLDAKGIQLRSDLHKTMNQIGEDLQAHDKVIDDVINSYGPLNNYVTEKNGNLLIGKFDFEPLLGKFDDVAANLEKPRPGLTNIKQEIQNGGYLKVADKIRDLNDMIANASPYDRKLLGGLKHDIQKIVDENLKNLPGDAGKLYEQRMATAAKYGKLADVREGLSLRPSEDNALIADTAKLMANPTETAGKPAKRLLENIKEAGDQNLNITRDELLDAANEFNRVKINPTKGEMGLGQDEILSKQADELFGAAKEAGLTPNFANTIEELNKKHPGLSANAKQQELLDYLRATYGDKADDIIKELQNTSKRYNTLKGGFDNTENLGDITQETLRFFKSISDPLAFKAGQSAQQLKNIGNVVTNKTNALANKVGIDNLTGRFNTLSITRPATSQLTRPQGYKQSVEEFKKSQNQGADVESE